MGLHIQLDKSSSTCVDFGFGRLSGFFRDLNFSVPSRIWYLLVSLAIQNLERNLGDRISYSIREHLKNLQKIPSDFTWISRKHQETATRAPVDLTLHIEFSSTLSFVARCCAREAGSIWIGEKMESCKNGAELIDVNWGSSSSLVGMEKQQHFALCTLAEGLRVNQKHLISTALSCPCLDWTNYCMLDIHDIVCAHGIWLCSVAIIYMICVL